MIQTTNPDWGFYGTMAHQTDPGQAWDLTLPKLVQITGWDEDTVQIFLDSRYGRHFADTVSENLFLGKPLDQAIDAAIKTWMAWRVTRRTAKDWDAPLGEAYLTANIGLFAGQAAEAA